MGIPVYLNPEQTREKLVFNLLQTVSKNWEGAEKDFGKKFTATPQVEQILISLLVEYSGMFLRDHVNIIPVDQLVGERIVMSVTGSTASTNNTSVADRVAKDILELGDRGYQCRQINNDIKMPYARIDSWANQFDDFMRKWQAYIIESILKDILTAGWNGVSWTATSDIVTYPSLQDVNKGWLQILREFNSGSQWQKGKTLACTFTDTGDVVTAAGHGLVNGQIVQFSVITTTTGISINTDYYVVNAASNTFQVSATEGGAALALTTDGTGTLEAPISIGTGKDYTNLDVLVNDIVYTIDEDFRDDLVCYVSSDLVKHEKSHYYEQTVDRQAEKLLGAMYPIQLLETYGGLRTFIPKGKFPKGTILVCKQKSLQYINQRGSRRRLIEHWAKGDCYNDWNSVQSCYDIELEEACFLMENVDSFGI